MEPIFSFCWHPASAQPARGHLLPRPLGLEAPGFGKSCLLLLLKQECQQKGSFELGCSHFEQHSG